MRIQIALGCALLGVCIALALTVLTMTHAPMSERTYTVVALIAGLQRRPNPWLDRPLMVEARAIATCACRHEQDLLVDPGQTQPPDAYTSIPLVIEPSNLAVFVRGLPLLGTALAPPPRLPLTGTFRVSIERDPKAGGAMACAPWCYRAIWIRPLWRT